MEIKTLIADDDGENASFFEKLMEVQKIQMHNRAQDFMHKQAMPYLKSALRYCYEKSEDGSELVNRTIVRDFIEEMICQLSHDFAIQFSEVTERSAAQDAEFLVYMQERVIQTCDLTDDTREYFAFIDRINFG